MATRTTDAEIRATVELVRSASKPNPGGPRTYPASAVIRYAVIAEAFIPAGAVSATKAAGAELEMEAATLQTMEAAINHAYEGA